MKKFLSLLLIFCAVFFCACNNKASVSSDTDGATADTSADTSARDSDASSSDSASDGTAASGDSLATASYDESSSYSAVTTAETEASTPDTVGYTPPETPPDTPPETEPPELLFDVPMPIIELNSSVYANLYSLINDRTDVFGANDANKPNGDITITTTDPTGRILGSNYIVTDMPVWIRGKGHGSRGDPKRSFRFKLDKNRNLFGANTYGRGNDKDYTLTAYCSDYTGGIRGTAAFELSRGLSNIDYTTPATLVEVYVNGQYIGVYLLAEEIQVDGSKVNITVGDYEHDVENIGYLITMDSYASGPTVFHANAGWKSGEYAYEIKSEVSGDPTVRERQRKYIDGYVEAAWAAVVAGNRALIEEWIDIETVIDTYIVEEVVKNHDAGWSSFFFTKDVGGKLRFGPLWDFDQTGGLSAMNLHRFDGLYVAGNVLPGENEFNLNPWFVTLMKYEWFREMLVERWNSPEVHGLLYPLPDYVENTANLNWSGLIRNFEMWGGRSNVVNGTYQNVYNSTKNKPDYTSETGYAAQVAWYKSWLSDRIMWMDDVFNRYEFVSEFRIY